MLALLLLFQQDPLDKVQASIQETRSINLARTAEIVKVIVNEGTFLESQKKCKEAAEFYAKASEALSKALEAQEERSAWQRRAILWIKKAGPRAEKKKSDEGRVAAWRYAFDRISLSFQAETVELDALVRLGLGCFQEGQLDEAEDALKEAEERLPAILGKNLDTTHKNVRLAPLILAETYLFLGRYADAGAAARRLVHLVPDFGDEEVQLRDLSSDKEAYDSCIRKLHEHVGKTPDDADSRFLLGFQIYYSDKREQSKSVFEGLKKDDAGAKYFLERLK